MQKKIRFNTISLGSEPVQPDISTLIRFIRSFRGRQSDLITFKMIQSISAQQKAGIITPGTGGMFYQPRLEAAITCHDEVCFHESSDILSDIHLIIQSAGPVQSVLPAPHLLLQSPKIDDEEQYADYCDEYFSIIRDMRDHGITGHIIHAKEGYEIELERLSSKKTWFVIPEGDKQKQENLLEHQTRIALHNSDLPMLPDLMDHYEIRHLTIIDPDETGFRFALEYLDPPYITAGWHTLRQ